MDYRMKLSHAWVENSRRMTTDYEYKMESAEAMLQIVF